MWIGRAVFIIRRQVVYAARLLSTFSFMGTVAMKTVVYWLP